MLLNIKKLQVYNFKIEKKF